MAQQAAGAAGIEDRLSRLFPGMVWPAFPWRKGSPLIPIDREVAGPLFALFPEWAGDWNDFAPYLRQSGFAPQELPKVSVKWVSGVAAAQAQEHLERRAARGLVCSASSGTSVSTFYAPTLLAPIAARPAAEDDETAAVVSRLKERDMQILLVLRANEAASKPTAMKAADIAEEIKAIAPDAGRAFRKPYKRLFDLGLRDFEPGAAGGGHYLTPEGIRAADYIEKHVGGMEHVAKQIRRAAG